MPTITIELTEKEAAALYADQWEDKPLEEYAKRILQSAAKDYMTRFPNSMPTTIERYRQAHPTHNSAPLCDLSASALVSSQS
jgi:hypothetical protein